MSTSAADRPISPAGRVVAEAVGIGIWLVAAIGWGLWCWRGEWILGPIHLATAAGLILAIAVLARGGWIKLFGPVLFYEGIRSARRTRFFVLRWLYAGGLLLLLLWIHWIWSMSNQVTQGAANEPYKLQAELAQEFFYAFAVVQFAVVCLLTPAYVAGGVAEEKERRTLDFLLATDLGSREIVFGKLMARLGNLALFVMTGLPILSLMQFFGGIDPGLLLASFEVTALTACSLAGLGILMSVQRRRARDAIILTYLASAGYVVIASATWIIPFSLDEYRQRPARVAPRGARVQPPITQDDDWVWDTAKWINAGNPFSGLVQVIIAYERGIPLEDKLNGLLEDYALVHGLFAVGCVSLAMLRLRPIALAQAGSAPKKKRRFRLFRFRRPPIGRLPMLWKEVRIEGGLRFGWFGRILVALVIFLSFVPFIVIVYLLFFDPYVSGTDNIRAWGELGQRVNGWVRSINTIVSSLMLVGVAVRAAGAFGSERDRDTLTSLMTTPLTTAEIIWAKWCGSLTSVRLFLIWLGVVWAIGLVTGGVGIFAVPLQVIVWLCPAMFVAALGLFFSAACKTTLRATTWTIFGALIALGGHWVCSGMCCFLPFSAMGGRETSVVWLLELQAGLSPPFLFGAIPAQTLDELLPKDEKFAFMVAGAQVIWLVAAAVVLHLAHEKFRQLTNRQDRAPGLPRPLPPTVVPVNEK